MTDVKCKHRGIIKTRMSYKDKAYEDSEFFIMKSACAHTENSLNGHAALIENPLICADCSLREKE